MRSWGRPITEALLMELPAIATNWSGPTGMNIAQYSGLRFAEINGQSSCRKETAFRLSTSWRRFHLAY